MTKTMSIRMDQDNYEFLTAISKEEQSDLSKAVREVWSRAAESYSPWRNTGRVKPPLARQRRWRVCR